MLYIGLDVHVKRTTICVLDEFGKELMTREVIGTWTEVIEELEIIKEKYLDYMHVCFEASCGAGYLYDNLKKIARRVVVAHPGRVRLIFKTNRKNDRIDAKKLAFLLFVDQVPTAYIPDKDIRGWRQMIEHRTRLVDKRTSIKNGTRSLLKSHGMLGPYRLWTKKGIEWLKTLKFDDDLSEFRLSMLLDDLENSNNKIKLTEKILAKKAKMHTGVELLMSIPGVGIRTAEALVAYIDDPHRFSSSKSIGCYFGLVPKLDSSAGRDRHGHISKEGPPTVRRLLTEAAWISIRRSPKVKAYYERIMKGDPGRKKIAVIATAHYLSRVSFAMLKNGEYWDEAV